jgi:zinc D-Ala-D-Ala carboxypeptidase
MMTSDAAQRYNSSMKSICRVLAVLSLLMSSCGRTSADSTDDDVGKSHETSRSVESIHPDFDFSTDDFTARLRGLPEGALSDPRRFLGFASSMMDLPPNYLLPVSPERPLSPDFVPKDPAELRDLSETFVTREPMELDRTAAESLLRLVQAASRDGVDLMISSAYRAWEYQDEVYRRHIRLFGEDAAAGMSRPPGTSQHQLGTSVDFGKVVAGTDGFNPSDWRNWRFIGTEDAAWSWLADHAGFYGWSLSYPPKSGGNGGIIAEPWHWRWIGPDAVGMQREFFGGDQQALLEFWSSNSVTLEAARTDHPADGPLR